MSLESQRLKPFFGVFTLELLSALVNLLVLAKDHVRVFKLHFLRAQVLILFDDLAKAYGKVISRSVLESRGKLVLVQG